MEASIRAAIEAGLLYIDRRHRMLEAIGIKGNRLRVALYVIFFYAAMC
jgi:hypothetical protein